MKDKAPSVGCWRSHNWKPIVKNTRHNFRADNDNVSRWRGRSAFEPEALLFDEAFSALDAITRVELRREVRSILRTMNVPALFITHDQEEALELADRIVVLNEGQIVQEGTPFEVYNHPRNEFVATFLGAANVLLGRWSQGKVALGKMRLKAIPDAPMLAERQAVKIVFRPEDVVLNFQPQLLDTPYYLGRAEIEDISYIGHSERLIFRLLLWSPQDNERSRSPTPPKFTLVDETYAEGFPIVITRNKWEATEMELSVGDAVVVGAERLSFVAALSLRRRNRRKGFLTAAVARVLYSRLPAIAQAARVKNSPHILCKH